MSYSRTMCRFPRVCVPNTYRELHKRGIKCIVGVPEHAEATLSSWHKKRQKSHCTTKHLQSLLERKGRVLSGQLLGQGSKSTEWFPGNPGKEKTHVWKWAVWSNGLRARSGEKKWDNTVRPWPWQEGAPIHRRTRHRFITHLLRLKTNKIKIKDSPQHCLMDQFEKTQSNTSPSPCVSAFKTMSPTISLVHSLLNFHLVQVFING